MWSYCFERKQSFNARMKLEKSYLLDADILRTFSYQKPQKIIFTLHHLSGLGLPIQCTRCHGINAEINLSVS